MLIDQNIKQILVIRRDLCMIRGKEIAQASHASNGFFVQIVLDSLDRNAEVVLSPEELSWIRGSQTIVCLAVNSEAELHEIALTAKDAGLKHTLILDEGRTQFNHVHTYTALSIGPDLNEKINPITGHLKLYADPKVKEKKVVPVVGTDLIYVPKARDRRSTLLSFFIREVNHTIFEEILSGKVRFLILKDESGITEGDIIRLREISPELKLPTNRELEVLITHVLSSREKADLGLCETVAILSITVTKNPDTTPFKKDLKEP